MQNIPYAGINLQIVFNKFMEPGGIEPPPTKS